MIASGNWLEKSLVLMCPRSPSMVHDSLNVYTFSLRIERDTSRESCSSASDNISLNLSDWNDRFLSMVHGSYDDCNTRVATNRFISFTFIVHICRVYACKSTNPWCHILLLSSSGGLHASPNESQPAKRKSSVFCEDRAVQLAISGAWGIYPVCNRAAAQPSERIYTARRSISMYQTRTM